ncbi:GNAT family N-acetyltransferase [Gordonibacter sp. An230]|uniref:GNAT family N-acetyltransferase n=1 Tax=Gordonibacter sp. An230 TaxID=1965592 RepID=UPI000B3AAF88|nr:GNAT family N-acetyltransferase [Gordonibacter sp. An230]OUO86535.1 GNAT family N-acetyltransferase [Gordonibacter sp. An230]
MNLPGLITVRPEQTDELNALAAMVGACFREEMWHVTWLDVPGISEERKLAITQAAIHADYAVTAPYGCVYALPNHAGAANAFLRSELPEGGWEQFEKESERRLALAFTPEETAVLGPRAEAMESLSDTNWPLAHAKADEDFIYFISIGIDPARRGAGAFRRLFVPFLDEADQREVRCYLDCYTDRLESLYGHFGFRTVERKDAPGFDLVERCMVREPGAQGAS